MAEGEGGTRGLRGILALSGKDRSEVIHFDEFDILENSSLVVIIMFFKVRSICVNKLVLV